jgi:hypothetical protein
MHDWATWGPHFRLTFGDDWRKFAAIPPMFYPTHSFSMPLSITGARVTHISAHGFVDPGADAGYGVGRNPWDNPFSNTVALARTSDGGTLRIGDTLTEGEDLTFTGIPNFAPEIVRRVRLTDPLKAKHLQRALESLAEEGVTQVFKPKIGSQWFVGVVGQLQLEVLASRIAAEYGLEVAFEQGMFETARWVTSTDPVELKKFLDANQGNLADDRDGSPVFMAKSAWELRYVAERFPKMSFTATRERHH